jgi:methyl-accepting chemotaxis protein
MRLTIAKKLYGGFAVVLALMVVLGLLGLSKLGASNQDTTFLGDMIVPGVEATNHLDMLTADYRAQQLHHLLATDAREKEKVQSKLDAIAAEVQKGFDHYRVALVADAHDRQLLDQTRGEWNRYVTVTQRVKTLRPTCITSTTSSASATARRPSPWRCGPG